MIIKRSDLYKVLRTQLKGDYSIGLHGISSFGPSWLSIDSDDKEEEVHNTAQEIIKNGLKVYSGRPITGTVAFFGRIDDADNVEHLVEDGLMHYNYAEREIVIVAVPTTFRSESGESLYLGDTNLEGEYKSCLGSTGYKTSTLRDEALSETVVPNTYILGEYKLLPNGLIDLYLNRDHMSFKGNIIDAVSFDKIKEKVNKYIKYHIGWFLRDVIDTDSMVDYNNMDEDARKKLYENLKNALNNGIVLQVNREKTAAFLETLKQYINEDQMRKLDAPEEINLDELLESLMQNTDEVQPKKVGLYHEGDDVVECLKKLNSCGIEMFDKGVLGSRKAGGVEYLHSLCGSEDFLRRAFMTYNNKELRTFFLAYARYIDASLAETVFTQDVCRKVLITVPNIINEYPFCQVINDQVIKDAVAQGGIHPMIIHYVSKELLDDFDFISSVINNSTKKNFDFYYGNKMHPESDLLYGNNISKKILTDEAFWNLLNEKLKSFREHESDRVFQFDKEKEIKIYKQLQLEENRKALSERASKLEQLKAEGRQLDMVVQELEGSDKANIGE